MQQRPIQGAGRTLALASKKGRHAVVKVVLEHWSTDDADMVICSNCIVHWYLHAFFIYDVVLILHGDGVSH